MKRLYLLILLLSSWNLYAKEIFPEGCLPQVIHGKYVLLTADKPMVVMMHNLYNTKVWITHESTGEGAQAGWSSSLESGKWSALGISLRKHAFKLSCIESRPGHEQPVACSEVLALCQWPHATWPKSKKGTFWAAENMDMLQLKAYLLRMGFELN